eukprot:CAMPEP_0181531804 /NCGR_PEP_ID=MMETSP1110-20121109/72291_1 /TAXON_ID=174948 /ORGANISM="Symbiodinium sp., Strain CCMP421" /LENGTH=283 /DNA_ID=CAMNT_0023662889 /DNA_START=42 /DNA_END=893 /DNA_ORIENTATION=-
MGEAPKAKKQPSKRSKRHADEAAEIVANFCEEFPPARVEPTRDEIANLWERCYGFKSVHLAAAINEQLSLQSGESWQPRLRALCLLEQCFETSLAPRLVAMRVFEESGEVLNYLANQVPQCSEQARKILRLCTTPAPLPSAITVPAAKPPPPPPQPSGPSGPSDANRTKSTGLVNARGRRKKNPERQALLSDVDESAEPTEWKPLEPLKDLETETTASSDDDAKKQLKEEPFDPNMPLPDRDSCDVLEAIFQSGDAVEEGAFAQPSSKAAKVEATEPKLPPPL